MKKVNETFSDIITEGNDEDEDGSEFSGEE
jgi:hypothetical protein